MSTAFSPIFIPNPATELAKITTAPPFTEKVGRVEAAEATLFERRFLLYELTREQARFSRHMKLKIYASEFGFGALALLVISILCVAVGIPYEPALACFFVVLGIYVVYRMKIRDDKYQQK